jgi:transposase
VIRRVPSKQTIHNLVNKLKTTGLLIYKKQKHKRRALAKEKLDDIGARLEHTPRKSLKCLAQVTECQSLVQEGQHDCCSLDPVKQQ